MKKFPEIPVKMQHEFRRNFAVFSKREIDHKMHFRILIVTFKSIEIFVDVERSLDIKEIWTYLRKP